MTLSRAPRDPLDPAEISDTILEAAYLNLRASHALAKAVSELGACQEANAAVLDYAACLAQRLEALGEA
ncbi:hypothetical protein [Solirubrobacter deserti]|uniref:Uncharacterized protein n=1 Tax=Solirubrobacter deserti TaxID=2282478 RepID=A0ABT4RDI9_9ACTN|nr:hypothetical protein [Solirubrobacter deserti]MDA0136599.1 hypothetical protein [Solirubrobacter deserti]